MDIWVIFYVENVRPLYSVANVCLHRFDGLVDDTVRYMYLLGNSLTVSQVTAEYLASRDSLLKNDYTVVTGQISA